MSGARPSTFKKGGGFLNDVDGVITGYQFTDEFNGKPFAAGKNPVTKKDRFHALYFVLSARVDGAEEDVTTTLFAGGADDYEVSDDGLTVTPNEDGNGLGFNTALGKFITSLCEAGFPEDELPADEINYEAIIGRRVRFKQRTNEDDTKKLGKRKGKDGKEYNRQDLIVEAYYGSVAGAAKSTKTAVKPAKVLKPGVDEVAALAVSTLADILSKKDDGKLHTAKLTMAVLSAIPKHKLKEQVRSYLNNVDNLASIEGVLYDADTKILSLEA